MNYFNIYIRIAIIYFADFRHIRDRIIASVPGRYSGSNLSRFGHMKLRRTLAQKFSAAELDKQKLRIGQVIFVF